MKRISWASFSKRRRVKVEDWVSTNGVRTYEELVVELDKVNVIAPDRDSPEVVSAFSEDSSKESDVEESDSHKPEQKKRKRRVSKSKKSEASNEGE